MAENEAPIISPKVANHVLHYHHSDEGFSGGSFSDCFFRLAALGDESELEKLATVYPAEIAAFTLARKPGGIAALRMIAAMPLLTLVSE